MDVCRHSMRSSPATMGSIKMPSNMSDSSSSPPDSSSIQQSAQPQKRTADVAGFRPNGLRPNKSVKRRASKACQCCRARKVRCNVVEHGAPCTNCRLDEVECIVSESKRKKKWTSEDTSLTQQTKRQSFSKPAGSTFATSAKPPYEPLRRSSEHTPHALYQDLDKTIDMAAVQPRGSLYSPNMIMNLQRLGQRQGSIPESIVPPLLPSVMSPVSAASSIPAYIKPLPARFGNDEISYLENRGALTIPNTPLRNELLRCYVEFVHPYMPLLNIHEVVSIVDENSGRRTISLLLFQAIMFAGIATVDMRFLAQAGFETRKDARREFFQRTRLLYDFDYEMDRIALIQALLLMTYWYETPDDQKDSHHWMGIAVSLSHTIGLHRNPEHSTMEPQRRKLWKRIWWSTYMRDRLIALGMRRPTRIKDSDFDVPMLEVTDFEDADFPEGPSCMPPECRYIRDKDMQRKNALMCVEKAKLCVCISHVLSLQYSVLNNNHGATNEEGSTRTTMMLGARKFDTDIDQVQACDEELQNWKDNLCEEARYFMPTWTDMDSAQEPVVLSRSLLHMVYYAALSALHRPQVLPSATPTARSIDPEALEISRKAVRLAASEITNVAHTLFKLDLVRCLPTTGITVLLPAIIIHLLDIKAPDEATRRSSLQGFCQCMQIMARLRDIYAAADYSTAFLEAAIRKAEITLPQKSNEVKEPRNTITCAQGLVDAGRRMRLVAPGPDSHTLTPPPEDRKSSQTAADEAAMASAAAAHLHQQQQLSDEEIGQRLNTFLASTPPDSDLLGSGSEGQEFSGCLMEIEGNGDIDIDFDSLINLDAAGEGFALEDGAYAAMQGESSGFTMDMDWMKGMKTDSITMPV